MTINITIHWQHHKVFQPNHIWKCGRKIEKEISTKTPKTADTLQIETQAIPGCTWRLIFSTSHLKMIVSDYSCHSSIFNKKWVNAHCSSWWYKLNHFSTEESWDRIFHWKKRIQKRFSVYFLLSSKLSVETHFSFKFVDCRPK